ncbi:glycosyltransferase family 4 protein [Flavobacterium reichenbachii]|uniref:Glycosyl transferase family 1 n=1 Tax=Flavobacterium reichenbachii TaxID=362418 RepID=A0A085ZN74_9FLAO|nr:glycosyltransferase family 4 protein [Flavobacterium reichenbachii]KFF05888.1 glycosyl transferase family 1 [Flavobacterium reichenbachii]OXB12771.1 glycosyl transferase family 1 [Flavobacterium reichenbachii]
MTIIHVSAVKNWGGGENHIETLCFELKESNPEVKNIILCVKDRPFHERLKKTDITFETAPLAYNLDFRFSLKLIQIAKKYKPDVIHIHDPSAIALSIIADKLYKLPPFIFSKKTSFEIKHKKLTLYKYNYPKIKKIFCVSNETKRICEKSIEDKNKLVTIYHGTSLLNKNSETLFNLREKFAIDPSKTIIGNIGNHIRAKNLETFVEIVDHIINKLNLKNFYFIQIGTFTDRTDDLINKIVELKLENHVQFLGYTLNASNYIPQFDIFLMTSQSEGIPEVIFESFYHKRPVISTDVGGIPEIIEDEINGLLTPRHNPELMSKKIVSLSNDQISINNFTDLSYKKLMSSFLASTMAQNMLKEYKNLAV